KFRPSSLSPPSVDWLSEYTATWCEPRVTVEPAFSVPFVPSSTLRLPVGARSRRNEENELAWLKALDTIAPMPACCCTDPPPFMSSVPLIVPPWIRLPPWFTLLLPEMFPPTTSPAPPEWVTWCIENTEVPERSPPIMAEPST